MDRTRGKVSTQQLNTLPTRLLIGVRGITRLRRIATASKYAGVPGSQKPYLGLGLEYFFRVRVRVRVFFPSIFFELGLGLESFFRVRVRVRVRVKGMYWRHTSW